MESAELFSRVCQLDSKMSSQMRELESSLSELRMKASARTFTIWLAMSFGFYLVALFGLCLIREAYTNSVREMRRELMVMHLSPPPQGDGAEIQ